MLEVIKLKELVVTLDAGVEVRAPVEIFPKFLEDEDEGYPPEVT